MSRIQCCTADLAPGSLAQRIRLWQLAAARQTGAALAGVVFLAALLIAAGKMFGILISNTDSAAPAGVYRVVSADFGRGDLVAACLPVAIAQEGLARGYLHTGPCAGGAEPVGKLAGALPGDVVEIEPGWVAINGRQIARSATAARDSRGRALTHVAWGARRVADNEVWLFGFNDRRSWDARYFGPVPLASVKGKLQQVLRW